MGLLDTDENELHSVIMGLRNNCAAGWDSIPVSVLKSARFVIIPALKHVINLCFNQGIFPKAFKKAVVHPVYKNGERDKVTNYRPISVLTTLSKVMERVLNNRLTAFLNKQNILSENQFGFRKGVSTEDAISVLTDHVVNNIEAKNKVIGVFIDLTKAFDTVSLPILVDRLESIGIRGKILDMFQDYLTNRTQVVRISSHTSREESVSYGVPQGSVLGPTLFLIYINNLCKLNIANTKIISYADDTVLLVHGKNWSQASSCAQKAIDIVKTWLTNHLLTLNPAKTKCMTFSASQRSQPPESFSIKIHHSITECKNCVCPKIDHVSVIKYLGINLDKLLRWNSHINLLTQRIRKLNYVFRKITKSADDEVLRLAYLALVQSQILYGISVWGGSFATTMLRLERAQRATLKVIYKKPARHPTHLLYKECSLLTVRQLYIMALVLRKHAAISVESHVKSKKRNIRNVCEVGQCRTAFASRHSCVLGSRLYNKINKILNISTASRNKCRQILTSWLKTLNYTETEELLKIVK